MSTSKQLLLLVDGNALVYRAYHAFPRGLTAADGTPTGAVYGFCRILFSTIKTLQPTHLAVAFDMHGPTFRHVEYAAYKATRSETPEELLAQMPVVHDIVDRMEAPVYAMEGYEADDLIGTIARQVEETHPELQVVILTSDRDLLQLINEQTSVYVPAVAPKKPTLYTPEKVTEQYGFAPRQMIDYKALRGDPSDNLPGVKGIGDVTATQLIKQFHTIDELYKQLSTGTLEGVKPGIIQKLREHEADARLSYKLATIATDVPVSFDPKACRLEVLQPENLVEMFRKLNFRSLLEELPGSHKLAAAAADIFGAEAIASPEPESTTGSSESEQFDAAIAPILRGMEECGVKVDVPYLAELESEFTTEISELTQQLHDLAGQPFNPDSPQQVATVLYDYLKIPTTGIRKGKTGFTTDAETLAKLAPTYPIAALLLQYREITKLQSTYVKPLQALADENDRVHTNYAPDTSTGRISSRNPNLQNIPTRSEQGRRIRKAFTTDQNWVLIAADYSQIELRVAAHLSEDAALIEAFLQGDDFHAATATKMGVDRRTAKIINFSILYGKGAYGFSQDLGITLAEAKQYIDQYFRTFSGLRTYLDQVLTDARSLGYSETMYGRRRYFPDITSSNYLRRSAAEREALNLPIQGTAADILKKAMSNLDEALRSSQSPARLILTVHDELVLEAPAAQAAEAAKLLADQMTAVATLKVPLIVEVKQGENWAEMEPLSL
jgi:DNA polymerase I-like protein with 3'-5' exonuclease and polymerase domains